jgi:hypothetical protein
LKQQSLRCGSLSEKILESVTEPLKILLVIVGFFENLEASIKHISDKHQIFVNPEVVYFIPVLAKNV